MSERTNSEQERTSDNANAIARPERCPECGFDTDATRTPAPRMSARWTVALPTTVVLLVLAAFIVWLIRTSETSMIGSGTYSPQYLSPSLTLANVRAAAEQPTPDGAVSLYDAVMRSHAQPVWGVFPGNRLLEIGFTTAPGLHAIRTSVGWPLHWCHHNQWAMYQDAARRQNPIPIVSDPTQMSLGANTSITPDGKFAVRPRWSWNFGNISYRPPPEETGGVSVWKDIALLDIVSSLGLALLVGVVFGVVC